ncbi:unnamed protein product [Prorocentrum cordatum]|uniref:Uncharacterized protein n=1 Tax=Prorocentrum cordatum TaxID=2364126 RepID=A0ABN9SK31_9DINO|nr:unnamed protein product [Polarella glacialis]
MSQSIPPRLAQGCELTPADIEKLRLDVHALHSAWARVIASGEQFDGCKFCKRPWSTPNPVVKDRGHKPTLVRCKPRSLARTHCNTCLCSHHSGEDKESLRQEISESPENQTVWNAKVKTKEDLANGLAPRTYTRGARKTITGKESCMLELKSNVGIFWPEDLWAKHHPDKPALKKELKTIPTLGRGVIRDEEFGRPIGTTDMAKVRLAGTEHTSTVYDGHDTEESRRYWAIAQKRANISSSSATVHEEGQAPYTVHSVSFGGTKKKKSDDDDVDDVFQEMLELSIGPGSGKVSSGGGGGGTARPQAGKNRQHKGSLAMARLTKEVSTSEVALLNEQQMLRSLASSDSFETVTVKTIVALENKLSSRLSPALIQIYTESYVPEGGTAAAVPTGIDVLGKLRSATEEIAAVKPLVVELHSPTKHADGGKKLHDLIRNLSDDSVAGKLTLKLPSALIEESIDRELAMFASDGRYDEFMSVLNCSARQPAPPTDGSEDPVSQRTGLCLNSVGANVRADVQTEKLLKYLVSILRVENNTDAFVKFMTSLQVGRVLSAEMRAEFSDLVKIVDEMTAVCARIKDTTDRRTCKPMTLLPSGIEVIASGARWIEQRAIDHTISAEFRDMLSNAEAVKQKTNTSSATYTVYTGDGKGVRLPDAQFWQVLHKQHCKVKDLASVVFTTRNNNAFNETLLMLNSTRELLSSTAKRIFDDGASELAAICHAKFLPSSGEPDTAALEDVVTKIDALLALPIYKASDISLHHVDVEGGEFVTAFEAGAEQRRSSMATLKSALPYLSDLKSWPWMSDISHAAADYIAVVDGDATALADFKKAWRAKPRQTGEAILQEKIAAAGEPLAKFIAAFADMNPSSDSEWFKARETFDDAAQWGFETVLAFDESTEAFDTALAAASHLGQAFINQVHRLFDMAKQMPAGTASARPFAQLCIAPTCAGAVVMCLRIASSSADRTVVMSEHIPDMCAMRVGLTQLMDAIAQLGGAQVAQVIERARGLVTMIRSQTHKKAQSSVDAIKHEAGATAAAMSERLEAIKWHSSALDTLDAEFFPPVLDQLPPDSMAAFKDDRARWTATLEAAKAAANQLTAALALFRPLKVGGTRQALAERVLKVSDSLPPVIRSSLLKAAGDCPTAAAVREAESAASSTKAAELPPKLSDIAKELDAQVGGPANLKRAAPKSGATKVARPRIEAATAELRSRLGQEFDDDAAATPKPKAKPKASGKKAAGNGKRKAAKTAGSSLDVWLCKS